MWVAVPCWQIIALSLARPLAAARSSSVTLEPGLLSPQPTLDTANVFVFNQLLLNIVVNMQSLPRSSETAEQRPISERTRSQRRRSAEKVDTFHRRNFNEYVGHRAVGSLLLLLQVNMIRMVQS